MCVLFSHTDEQYSAAEYTRLIAEVLSEFKSEPQSVPVSFCIMLLREPNFAATFVKCVLYVRVLSSETPRYLGKLLCCTLFPQKVIVKMK